MKNDLTAEHLAQEVTLVLPLSAVLRLGLDGEQLKPLYAVGESTRLDTKHLPAIGEKVGGEIFAGLSIDEDGRPCQLWLIDAEKEAINWKDAMGWAITVGGVLPSRIDQLVLLRNLKREFKEDYYWSSSQHADDADWAWYQNFGYGYQYCYDKDSQLRARAVRREPI